ncbi:MAG: S1 RNA-binding domain-containing protein, partial [Bacteroidales bacterium]|nr:S1 RNA-binding domain-containing protein [Bacteroidales bacterium]
MAEELENTAAEAVKTEEKVVEKNPIVPNDPNFDWDSLGEVHTTYSEEERKKMEEVYNQTFNAIVEQDVVEGTIVGKTSREIVVNIGFKSDGVIPINELRYNPNFKIGDPIEVYVESQEDSTGQLLLSHKKALLLKSWKRINEAYEKEEIITGHIKSKTKGGLIVDVFG